MAQKGAKMQLQEVHGKSKKTGKEYTGYTIKIGEYNTPLFFPTKIELMYIKDYLKKRAHGAFHNDQDDELSDDEEEDE